MVSINILILYSECCFILPSGVYFIYLLAIYQYLLDTASAAAVISAVSDSAQSHRQQSTRLLCPQDSPGKNTGVGCHLCLHYWILITRKALC